MTANSPLRRRGVRGLLGQTYPTGLVRAPLHPKAADYRLRPLLDRTAAAAPPTKRVWSVPQHLNQRNVGACVGFAYAAELTGEPAGDRAVTAAEGDRLGFTVYKRARKIGGYYSDGMTGPEEGQGVTMEAGALAARDLGLISGFYWADSIDDVRDAVLNHGPVPIALYVRSWLTMPPFDGTVNRLKRSEEPKYGAHAMCVVGYDPAFPFKDGVQPGFLIRNSWGADWIQVDVKKKVRVLPKVRRRIAKRFPNRPNPRWKIRWSLKDVGQAWMRADDLEFSLAEYGWEWGSAVLPVGRVAFDTGDVLSANPDPFGAPYDGTQPGNETWQQP